MPEAVARLQAHYTDAELARMVTAEPLLLVEDVDAILAELERLAGSGSGDSAQRALLADPSLAAQVAGLSNLSLW